ncbi:Ribbon-helix-helix protein, copG family [Paraburkholderia fungorum]|uniref:Ribbon-helix-helix protein, copG family n=1 Tax=Paraburkholderia fungorum TaxID=134537 RepID=A0A1H1IYD4_9BURK|nr:CopG family transcriptional regulator [Paraburkholderia fungorum]SDR42669.1 Ribbon-helix-helix protein, copG family [Paraburkholderia fungorum]
MATNEKTQDAKPRYIRENFRIPEAIVRPMELLAEKRSVTKSEILRNALREYYARQPELMEPA